MTPFSGPAPLAIGIGTGSAWQTGEHDPHSAMAQSARSHGIADAGHSRSGEGAWLHDLTPTLSDGALFDADGIVRPLATLPVLPRPRRAYAPLRLVGKPAPRLRRA